jgi:hypothetical protein
VTGKNTFFTPRLGSKFRISIARAEAPTVNKLETSEAENKKGKMKNGSTQLVSERAEIEGEVIKHLTNYVKGGDGLESSALLARPAVSTFRNAGDWVPCSCKKIE